MKSKHFFSSLLLASLGVIAGCNPPESKAPSKETPPVAVKLVQPKRGDITRSVSLPGNVIPDQQAALHAKVTGYLKTIHVDKGDSVKEGDLLAEIEVPELLADLAKSKAEVEVADIDYKRILEAQQKAPSLVVAQSIDTARAKSLVAKASLEHAETLLQFCKIIAPFSGTITKRSVDPGAFIAAATSGNAAQSSPIVTLADFSKVRVQVAVPEPETPFIRNDLPVKIYIDELPGTNFTGTVTRFSHSLDDATKTMLVEIDLPNADHKLLPGMYANVKLGVETHANALLIPLDALVTEKTGTSVFKLNGGKAQKVPVKTGFTDGANVEILEGVTPEEPLILVGKQTLSSGQPVTVTEGK
ncbi:efflux RND transporter periplasmic adaptor subunit [Pedosphaera parvula]|uniref:Efflux transporter, RND family, MFP subunit n=1 Tax=Pedosphaera parvula (strain Ellin514) TaxID=320771 RepID=B9XRK3_PEDPL|nr:efflux RND transporter periplasmic adaptor subunit [Pedosphaera parvula]EEF57522.1 efflux transporter, RND family, MFP subunit [Pedosphaera parvula Ellin514]